MAVAEKDLAAADLLRYMGNMHPTPVDLETMVKDFGISWLDFLGEGDGHSRERAVTFSFCMRTLERRKDVTRYDNPEGRSCYRLTRRGIKDYSATVG